MLGELGAEYPELSRREVATALDRSYAIEAALAQIATLARDRLGVLRERATWPGALPPCRHRPRGADALLESNGRTWGQATHRCVQLAGDLQVLVGEPEAAVVDVVGRGGSGVPSDAETAALMRELAEAFREINAEQGDAFGWETREASKLDAVCDRFLGTGPSPGLRHSMVMAMGAYLGELMARHGEGRWLCGAGEYGSIVLLANGLFCHPHEQVAMRLELGPQLDLGFYFHYALAGHLGQDTLAG